MGPARIPELLVSSRECLIAYATSKELRSKISSMQQATTVSLRKVFLLNSDAEIGKTGQHTCLTTLMLIYQKLIDRLCAFKDVRLPRLQIIF